MPAGRPFALRRVVTGIGSDGAHGPVHDEVLNLDDTCVCPVAEAHGSRVLMCTVPPGDASPAAPSAATEMLDEHGFHATTTVDTVVVISGEVSVEFPDGREVILRAGDVLVQNGTVHAWRNRGSGWPLVAAFVVDTCVSAASTPGSAAGGGDP